MAYIYFIEGYFYLILKTSWLNSNSCKGRTLRLSSRSIRGLVRGLVVLSSLGKDFKAFVSAVFVFL